MFGNRGAKELEFNGATENITSIKLLKTSIGSPLDLVKIGFKMKFFLYNRGRKPNLVCNLLPSF